MTLSHSATALHPILERTVFLLVQISTPLTARTLSLLWTTVAMEALTARCLVVYIMCMYSMCLSIVRHF